jgi:hypothetical protein
MPDDDTLWTPKELAAYLGLSPAIWCPEEDAKLYGGRWLDGEFGPNLDQRQ